MTTSNDPALTRIEEALQRAGAEHSPPAGWQARVLAATEPAPRAWWRWLTVPVLAGAAAGALWLAWPHANVARAPAPLQLALVVERGGPLVRGSSAHVGDVVHATASGGRHRAVWVYRNDAELLVACPGASTCRAAGDSLTADVTIAALGAYSVVALSSDAPLPAPTGQLDADVAAAAAAGARYKIEPLAVQ